jgi:hypothetical protein
MMCKRARLSALVLSWTSAMVAYAQPRATVVVGANIRVSRGAGPYWEPSIAASPKSGFMVLSALVANDSGADRVESFWSADGGQRWSRGRFVDSDSVLSFGDLAVTIGDDDVAYESNASGDAGAVDRVVRASLDGGRSWSTPIPVPHGSWSGWDREFLVSGRMGAPGEGRRLAFLGTNGPDVSVASSTDSGRTFHIGTPACRRADALPRHVGPMPLPVVLSDGTLVVACQLYEVEGPGDSTARQTPIGVAVSRDGGLSFGPSHIVARVTTATPEQLVSYARHGQTIQTVFAGPGYLAADPSSGPYRDRLYLVWRDWGGQRAALYVAWSADKGVTWSRPHRVTSDWTGEQGQQMVVVNKNGVLGISWYDSHGTPKDQGYNVFFSASLDGGDTFLPPVRVTSATSWPLRQANVAPSVLFTVPGESGTVWTYAPEVAMRPSGGDYATMATDTNGDFHPAWVDARGGAWHIYTARIRVEALSLPSRADVSDATLCRQRIDDRVSLTIGRGQVDSQAVEVIVPVQVENTSLDTLFGPVVVTVRGLRNFVRSFARRALPGLWRSKAGFDWSSPFFIDGRGHTSDSLTYEVTGSDGSGGRLLPGDVTAARLWRIRYAPSGEVPPELKFETSVTGSIRRSSVHPTSMAGDTAQCRVGGRR